MKRVIIEVEKGNENCTHGHKTGQRIILDGTRIIGDICIPALVGIFPVVYAVKNGVKLRFADDDGKVRMCCGDPDNTVFFKCWLEEKEENVD